MMEMAKVSNKLKHLKKKLNISALALECHLQFVKKIRDYTRLAIAI